METDTLVEKNFEEGTDALIVALYPQLRAIAHREHFRAGMPQTMQTTALIGEAYFRLSKRQVWDGRSHFLGCAATAMRHVLVDGARARMSAKRAAPTVEYDDAIAATDEDAELVRLGEVLVALGQVDPSLARLVDCRFFAGYDERETAEVLGISDRTVRRHWVQARAWIHSEMAVA